MMAAFQIIIGIGIGLVVVGLKNKVFTKIKDGAKEQFDFKKLRAGLFRVRDKVSWSKDIVQIFNIRRITIYLLIFSCIYGYGVYKGKLGKPVNFDLKGKEARIQLNEHFLFIKKDGTAQVEDKDGVVIKEIKVSDIPALRKALKPYGIDIKLFAEGGIAVVNKKIKKDIGIGLDLLKYYKWRIATWLSNNGMWVGVDYQITNNSGLLLGMGKSYKFDNMVGIQWRFWF